MDNEAKLKIFRIILGFLLMVALLVITSVQFKKYLREDTSMSIQYENRDWIELPSITICNDDESRRNVDQTNITFEEFAKNIEETHLHMIEFANFSYVNPTFEKYICISNYIFPITNTKYPTYFFIYSSLNMNLTDEKFWIKSYNLALDENSFNLLRPCLTLNLPQNIIYKPVEDIVVMQI